MTGKKMLPDQEMNQYMNKTGQNLNCQWGESIMTVRRKLMNCSVCVCVFNVGVVSLFVLFFIKGLFRATRDYT